MHNNRLNRVLIIGVASTSIFLTSSLLEDMAISKEILTAHNGRKGLNKNKQFCLNHFRSEQHCSQLILLDINMPIMDGFELVKELQKIGQNSLIKESIVVLTSSSNARDKATMQDFGVRQYIEKPISDDKLLPLIETL